MIAAALHDLRYGLRSLAARPMFALVAVLTLGLGIGANTAIFSVIHGLLLRPLPYAEGERLVEVYNRYPNSGLDQAGSSIPDYLDRRQATSVEDMALYSGVSFAMSEAGASVERLSGVRATPSLFSTLGVKPALGRVFSAAEAEPGAEQVLLLSWSLWQNRFNADPSIIGRDVRLNGLPYQVLGVMPEWFGFPNRNVQMWVPFAFSEQQKSDEERGSEFSSSIARLKPGASAEGAVAEFDTLISRNAERLAGLGDPRASYFAEFLRNGNFKAGARSLREQQVGDARPMLALLQAAVAMVLLIACANVANLMLARLNGRRKELTLRSALGASRRRIALQVLVEALLLASLGAALGLALAAAVLQLLPALGVQPSSADYSFRLDRTVMLYGLGLSLLAGLLAAAMPLYSLLRMDVGEGLREGGRSAAGGHAAARARHGLVIAQVALATTLLIGAGLLLRSFHALSNEDPGFSSSGLLTARIDLDSARFAEGDARRQFLQAALERLSALPGVEQVAFTSNLPFSNSNSSGSYVIEGREIAPGAAQPHGLQRQVSADYFEALGIPLLAGRYLQAADVEDAELVVVIDEHLAKAHFGGAAAIGQRLRRGGPEDNGAPWARVVGVVGTIKHQQLEAVVAKETVYWPLLQATPRLGSFVLRSERPAEPLAAEIREALRAVDPEQPVYDIRSLDERLLHSLQDQRAPMLLLGLFAAVALLLAAIGLYGVLAFAVGQRTGELGVRMAIGAGRRQVLGMVLGQGARVTAVGLGLGLLGAAVFGRIASSQLFGISAFDPLTYLGVCVFLTLVALLACYLPARRAAATDPMVALRYE